MTMKYEETSEFQKDFKKLARKFRTLPRDLETAKTHSVELFYIRKIDNRSVFFIPNFCSEQVKICKLKKFACRALKNRGAQTGIRIIYAFFPKTQKIVFIEMYFKANKANEDKTRIKNYLKSLKE